MRSPAGERGSVTAEFAVAVPAVLACLALCIATVTAAADYAGLVGSAAAAARLAARGDDPDGLALPRGASLSIEGDAAMSCVRVSAADGVLVRLGIRLSARACALDERLAR